MSNKFCPKCDKICPLGCVLCPIVIFDFYC